MLQGIEPDEIDIADGETGGEAGDGDGDPTTGDGDTTGDATGDGDGDGDPTTGDGDGDPTTGDGDGDPGDGDGDPTGDGDGDGDDVPCADLLPMPIYAGENLIDIADDAGSAFQGSCGGLGPDALFEYTATADGDVSFSLTEPSFDGVLYLGGPSCVPLTELACDITTVQASMSEGESIFVVVDSTQVDVGGTATLTVTPL